MKMQRFWQGVPGRSRTLAVSACTALMSLAAPALVAAPLSLSLEIGPQDDVRSIHYSCADGSELTVQYINSGTNSLAVMRLAGQDVILVNVVSGSGARYVSGAREWWTKGSEASLRNELANGTPLQCSDMSAS